MSHESPMMCDKAQSLNNNDFIINMNGTVTDPCARLMWKRFSEGQEEKRVISETSVRAYTWAEAQCWLKKINMGKGYAGYRNWRLPTKRELLSLVSSRHSHPSIDNRVFPHTPASGYWTASAFASGDDYAYSVDFMNGHGSLDFVSRRKLVRLVRDTVCADSTDMKSIGNKYNNEVIPEKLKRSRDESTY